MANGRKSRGQVGVQPKTIHEGNGDFSASQPSCAALGLRENAKNKAFVTALRDVEALERQTSDTPIRTLVIHCKSDEALWPTEEVEIHFVAWRPLLEYLVLCSRQGRLRPQHPEYRPDGKSFTRKVIRNPMER